MMNKKKSINLSTTVSSCKMCPYRQFYISPHTYIPRREIICSLTGTYIQDAITNDVIHETCPL